MESSQTDKQTMTVAGSTLEELARDFYTAVDAGKMPRERALTLLLEIVYANAVHNTAVQWFDIQAQARLREQVAEQKARMTASAKGKVN